MEYSFDIETAKQYGVDEAIMIKNFQFWINKNKACNTNFYDGHYWTYNSHKAFTILYPFWNHDQIRRIIKSLINQGVIITANYNTNAYDRTLWYAFKDEKIFLIDTPEILLIDTQKVDKKTPENDDKNPQNAVEITSFSICKKSQMEKNETQNRKEINPEPIPDNKPYSKPDNNTALRAFTPPTLKELQAYYQEISFNDDPEKFIDFYQSKNWMVGKTKMKDWRAAARNWKRMAKGFKETKKETTYRKASEMNYDIPQ